jgi:cell division protein ftsA
MQEQSHYAVGIDIGTKKVRCVIGHIDETTGVPRIIGVGQAPNSGMRKGVITHLNGPAAAIDTALDAAERMSGHRVNQAALGTNGVHIISTKVDGMVAVNASSSEVTEDDVARLENVATVGKVPANREILEVVPYEYRLDGQDNIKNPIGMTGTRLELRANVVSGLVPHLGNLHKLAEMSNIDAVRIVPTVLASAQAVLNELQMENGVAVIDIGASTTGVAVFEEGDLQHLSVVPMGSQNVTNDLAIGLKVDLEIAEKVKLQHGELGGETTGVIDIKHEKETQVFHRAEVAEIVEARYEEIFELVAKELKKAGGISKMPSGAVLVGGGAKVKGLAEFAKEQIGLAVKIGKVQDYAGMTDDIKDPEYAAAIGLMLAMSTNPSHSEETHGKKASKVAQKAGGFLGGLFAKFK